MNSVTLSLLILICILGGILLGAWLLKRLPEHDLTGDAKDVVRLGAGLIGTIAALVFGTCHRLSKKFVRYAKRASEAGDGKRHLA